MPIWTLVLLAPLMEVEWDAPDRCPDETTFLRAVESDVDLESEEGEPPVLTARVTIVELDRGRWRLTMVLSSEAGQYCNYVGKCGFEVTCTEEGQCAADR